jgi:thymidylate synthase (FAD)
MDEIKVLDHGYVKLVGSMGTDETIIEAARMSTGKGFQGWDADAKLLAFLYANKHMTPFEMCELAIEVQAPIFVFREWQRHRTQSYNEFSARYAQMPNLHYVPSMDHMLAAQQSAANKQGSQDGLDEYVACVERDYFADMQQGLYEHYEACIAKGVAKEVARINTPVSRYSKMRAKTDLRNWLAFLQLRMAPNAQWEIRQYANAVAEIVKALWPRTYALFEEHDLHGVHLSRSEAGNFKQLVSEMEQLLVENPGKTTRQLVNLHALRKKLGMGAP